MKQTLQLALIVLCSTAMTAAAQQAGVDATRVEAQVDDDEATKLEREGRYADAIPRAERALAIRETALGKDHPDVATALNRLATLYVKQGLYGLAEPLYERALAIREVALGKNHPDVATSLNGLGTLYYYQSQYSRAELLHQRALAIQEAALGKNHPDVATSLNRLALLYVEQGQYGRAEPLHQRALAIQEMALGKNHPDVAISLNNLALLYQHEGLCSRAGPLFERAVAIRETALGKDHPAVAKSLDNLANLQIELGQYGRAGPLLERAIAIQRAALGKDHPDVGKSLNDLALLYRKQGLYGQAESLHKQALAIRETAQGKNHRDVAVSLNNLANLYKDQELYRQAEPLYERALAIREAALGKNHPDVATTLNTLANLYKDQGLYRQAEPLYERALAIREVALEKDHPDVAVSLNGLADFYRDQGSYRQAEALYERALAILEAALGKSHPDVADSLIGLARLRLGQRRLAEAVPLFARALAISEGRLRHESLEFSESRLASFLQLLGRDGERLYSLLRVHTGNADVRRLALTSALLFKGRSVEEAADTSRTILRMMGPQDRDAFERLRGLHTQLAKLSLDGPGKLGSAEYQQRLKRLADEGDFLEADLAKRSAPLRALTALPSAADVLQRVSAALPQDSALVELMTYADRPPVPKPGTPESKVPAQLRYLALVLFPDGHTGAVDLGPADAIDKAASQLRDGLATRDAHFQAAAQKVYRLAFKPLLPLLGNARKVFLAPDGQLALVPFAALHDGRRFLADAFDFTYLTSGRDILPPPGNIPTSASAVIFADPDYSASPLAQASPSDAGVTLATAERSDSLERFFSKDRASVSEQPWVPLPGSRQEAEAIRRLLPQAQVFLGADASKERLLHLAAPGILHVATHGFFLPDAAAPPGARALGVQDLSSGDPVPRLPDPLLRSGLVLTGASSTADIANSIVTALELAGLNLWGTQLVVLSACDTGRGDVKRGQGVYGLRRALVVAGAETLVVSLWKVDDETTRTVMERYYRNLLAGQGRAAALREAMLSLRTQYPHPHFWAPFIALGRDHPLHGLASSAQQPQGR